MLNLMIDFLSGVADIIGLVESKGGEIGAMAERRATHADSWYSGDQRTLARYYTPNPS